MAMLPGYRFLPTDVELIRDYLMYKIRFPDRPNRIEAMQEVELYKQHPQTLTELYPKLSEREWYFFTRRSRRRPHWKKRHDRTTGYGFWKSTVAEKKVFELNGEDKRLVGTKTVLVYMSGTHKNSSKTNWIMHEFTANDENDLVLCRIRNNSKGKESVNVNDEEEYYPNDMSSAVIATDENETAEYADAADAAAAGGGDAGIETQAAVVGTNISMGGCFGEQLSERIVEGNEVHTTSASASASASAAVVGTNLSMGGEQLSERIVEGNEVHTTSASASASASALDLNSIVPPTDQLLVDPLFFVPIRDHPKPKPKPKPSNPSTAAPPQPP